MNLHPRTGRLIMAGHKQKTPHRCQCRECRSRGSVEVLEYHRSINRLMVEFDERSRRLFAGLMAKQLGRGGIQRTADITGLSRVTIRRGVRECERSQASERVRIRRAGGGRKLVEKNSGDERCSEGVAQRFDSGRSYGRSSLNAQIHA